MMKLIYSTALLLLLGVCACQKKDDTAVNADDVVITITSPQEGQTFHAGDTVFVSADVTYPSELHGYEVKITDTASGIIVYDETQHTHTDHFIIHDYWICAASQATNYKLELIASIDHEGHTAQKTRLFHGQP